MKRLRRGIGIALIASALISLGFWEVKGRSLFMNERVIVSACEILPGDELTEEKLMVRGVADDDLIVGALSPDDAGKLIGTRASSYIPANGQICESMVRSADDLIAKDGQSIFAIDDSWIRMKSNSLRRGDRVTLYAADSCLPVGSYDVAFVKDSSTREVTNPEPLYRDSPLDRADSTAPVSSIEIICTLDEYTSLVRLAEKYEDEHKDDEYKGAFIIVQEVA